VGQLGDLRVEARTCGVGMPAAAANAALHIQATRPRATILVGTCGAYRSAGLTIDAVVVSRRILLVDAGVLTGAAMFPAPMPTATLAAPLLVDALAGAGARSAVVATTLAVTVDDAVAAMISQSTGADVEHLEAYAVALACSALGVPFAALLGVANSVCADGSVQWRRNHASASLAAAKLLALSLTDRAFRHAIN